MGKRSNFKRRKSDAYDTPPDAVLPLLPRLPSGATFAELCAGSGKLMFALEGHAIRCCFSCDISPRENPEYRGWAPMKFDALKLGANRLGNCDYIITNPPWTRQILEPLITHFRQMIATFLLLPAEFAHTKYAAEHLKYCSKIVTVGRVRWIPGSPHTSLDSAAWYLFGRDEVRTEFIGRTA